MTNILFKLKELRNRSDEVAMLSPEWDQSFPSNNPTTGHIPKNRVLLCPHSRSNKPCNQYRIKEMWWLFANEKTTHQSTAEYLLYFYVFHCFLRNSNVSSNKTRFYLMVLLIDWKITNKHMLTNIWFKVKELRNRSDEVARLSASQTLVEESDVVSASHGFEYLLLLVKHL